MTAERFMKDPFSIDTAARMFKTGDLGRWRVDGSLEYLGRNDHQGKIRGFRIEFGEIESELARHPHVQEVVVLAREDDPGLQRLVGYLTVDLPALKAHSRSDTSASGTGIVSQWKRLYEDTYSAGLSRPSFVGWSSSC